MSLSSGTRLGPYEILARAAWVRSTRPRYALKPFRGDQRFCLRHACRTSGANSGSFTKHRELTARAGVGDKPPKETHAWAACSATAAVSSVVVASAAFMVVNPFYA